MEFGQELTIAFFISSKCSSFNRSVYVYFVFIALTVYSYLCMHLNLSIHTLYTNRTNLHNFKNRHYAKHIATLTIKLKFMMEHHFQFNFLYHEHFFFRFFINDGVFFYYYYFFLSVFLLKEIRKIIFLCSLICT